MPLRHPFGSDGRIGTVAVGGCLSHHWKDWLQIGAEKWIVSVLREGYMIPFSAPPPLTTDFRGFESDHLSSTKYAALSQEITLLRNKEAIEEAPSTPGFCSRMFVVPKKTGGFRPIIDLSTLNTYVTKTRFKMETTRSVMEAVRQGDWMASVDLQDAYLQVPMHQDSRRYLRFRWEGRSWQFRTLCFGLSTAPQVFTRLMGPISAVMHKQGYRLLRYLDDWLILATSKEEISRALEFLLHLCQNLGIQVNWEKSSLQPAQEKVYLGMVIRSPVLKAFPTQERLHNLELSLRSFLSQQSPPAKDWLRLLGLMSSLIYLVPNSRRRMRSLQIRLGRLWKRSSEPEETPVRRSEDIHQDLLWWLDVENLNRGQSLQTVLPELSLHSDASSLGWGASLLHLTVSGVWSPQEETLHINLLELRAIKLALMHFVQEVRGRAVALFTDNTTALAYLANQGGVHSPSLNSEAQHILSWAETHAVILRPRFIQGINNVLADALSRRDQVLSTEWTLNSEVCRQLWKLWGYPTIDLFATRANCRLGNFVSPYEDPQAIATDALLFGWNHQDLYAFPPFPLIRKVLNKLRESQNTRLILIAPFWPQKEWFPDLWSMSVQTPRLLPSRWDLLRQPHVRRFHQRLHELHLTAWRLSTVSSDTKVSRQRSAGSWPGISDIPQL